LRSVRADELREVSVCHSGYFRAKCAWDELIVIAHARYGRMRINKCVIENFGYVGCSIDVIDVLDRQCSGRRTCHVRVLDETFTETTPCHEDLNLYLQPLHTHWTSISTCKSTTSVYEVVASTPSLHAPSQGRRQKGVQKGRWTPCNFNTGFFSATILGTSN